MDINNCDHVYSKLLLFSFLHHAHRGGLVGGRRFARLSVGGLAHWLFVGLCELGVAVVILRLAVSIKTMVVSDNVTHPPFNLNSNLDS